MGTKFEEMTEDGKKAKNLKFSISNGLSYDNKEELYEDEHPGVHQDYFIYEGRQLTFNTEGDLSIARLEYQKVHEANHAHSVQTDTFDPYVFDSQYTRYFQVLDTDYDNYMLVYSCQEINEYHNLESGANVAPHDAWKFAEKKLNGDQIEYTYPEKLIHVQPVF